MADVRWLNSSEQVSWRAYLSASLLLQERLNRELQAAHDLTTTDYEILVRLSESPQRRLRMSELAEDVLSSRSRLSHQITRMAESGLVRREPCERDRRGFFAVLTEQGLDRLVAAAPTHVTGVRTHLLDQMSPAEFAELGRISREVADHLLPER
jgi:DNA-binding MarR family transcriptional regulator